MGDMLRIAVFIHRDGKPIVFLYPAVIGLTIDIVKLCQHPRLEFPNVEVMAI